MKTNKSERITVRLDNETALNIEIMNKATSTPKAQICRAILQDFFNKNDHLINQYYEKIKAK